MKNIKQTKEKLRRMFREYWNDYLTIDVYAQAHGMAYNEMYRIINLGRKLHNQMADKLKGGK